MPPGATLECGSGCRTGPRDFWWLPEVMRMRAADDDEQAAISRLRSAAQMAQPTASVTWSGAASMNLTD